LHPWRRIFRRAAFAGRGAKAPRAAGGGRRSRPRLAGQAAAGIFAYISDSDPQDWQSSIDIVLRRFTEYHDLEGAFGHRAITERAKGILMERHSVDEATAFEMLRDHARAANRKLVDIAAAVVDGHALLPKRGPAAP
jgi:AmiR/NasT family two-component response regulator